MARPTVAVIMGGRSSEREVSLVSGSAVARAIDRTAFEVRLVHIRQDGAWEWSQRLYEQNHLEQSCADALDPASHRYHGHSDLGALWPILSQIDLAFPVLHGPYGEDGTIQGLLETAGIPYVGGPVLFNSICMHKPTLKALLLHYGVPTPAFRTIHAVEWSSSRAREIDAVLDELELPVFVKPAALGSSIGISQVRQESALQAAIDGAFRYGPSVIVERAVTSAREIECAVMGNDDPLVSRHVGEIVPHHEFYDYESKYVHDSGLFVPAGGIPPETVEMIRDYALQAFRIAGGGGYARVDFLLGAEGPLLNEINTIPGFTEISMFPRLFMAEGFSFAQIVDKLISLAWERFERKTSA